MTADLPAAAAAATNRPTAVIGPSTADVRTDFVLADRQNFGEDDRHVPSYFLVGGGDCTSSGSFSTQIPSSMSCARWMSCGVAGSFRVAS